MQKYTPTSNHHRSMSLCNYDELCRTRKRENIANKRMKNDEIESDHEASENVHCESCPLNVDGLCEKHSTLNNTGHDICDNDEIEVNFKPSNSNCSTIIDMIKKDHSLKLVRPLKFSCSSFPLHDQTKLSPQLLPPLDKQQKPSRDAVKRHRRSSSLLQQFESGYDYLMSEIEYAKEFAGKTMTQASRTVSQATGAVWKVCNFSSLPKFMQDNEYLLTGHRPPLPTFWACAKSIFRLHTETGNIWTHGLGALLFLGLFIYEFITLSADKNAMDRLMLTIYFCGIILCLLFSCLFHTFSCYASPRVIKIFSKLDYCGISLQIIGSMTPALYYGFYEDLAMFKLYLSFGIFLCILSIAVSLWDKFGEPKYRSFRAFVFLCFGLSNVIPGVHWFLVLDSGLLTAYYLFILQGALYVIGSLLYANRIPERLFPGKCDYMFQSHQIFHVLVVLAALVHLNGINSMAEFRMNVRTNVTYHSVN